MVWISAITIPVATEDLHGWGHGIGLRFGLGGFLGFIYLFFTHRGASKFKIRSGFEWNIKIDDQRKVR
jgi:hypothetical protein